MNPDRPGDPLFELLARLPAEAPSRPVQDRLRARCHAALARQRGHAETRRHAGTLLDAAAFSVAGLYLAAAIATALRAAALI